MATEVRLPKLSDEMSEATISRWLKDVGESVDQGEPIVEVETEKVIVEVEATASGILLEIVAPEQAVVPVDTVLCRIGRRTERVAPRAPVVEPAGSPPEPPTAPAAATQAMPASPLSNVVSMPQRPAAPAGRPRGAAVSVTASPLARRVAEELGIDLMQVPGTGIGGKIVMADLQPWLEQAQPPAVSPSPAKPAPAGETPAAGLPAATADYEDVPHNQLRRTIARRMAEAKGAIPHFYMTVEVDVTDALALRERLNASLSEGRISVNDLIVKATALALEQVPSLNATWSEGALRRYAGVHIGVATAIEEGLVTPVVRDCQLKSIGRIARETAALIDKARRRALTAGQLNGGTFTVSNLGMTDVVEFSAIINPPQVGILAIAKPVERPVADDGRVVLRWRLRATLSADHRAVDGMTGAEFLGAFKAVLEHPERLML